ncbi:MAG: hypothetical protein HC830_01220 [Bacteroidetes bacterium]|nr:hypothetical protein [Bacteroidota bacterium]
MPVIIISGSDSNLLRNSFMKAGAADFIVKPFQPDEINNLIDKVLNKS